MNVAIQDFHRITTSIDVFMMLVDHHELTETESRSIAQFLVAAKRVCFHELALLRIEWSVLSQNRSRNEALSDVVQHRTRGDLLQLPGPS